MSAETTQAAIVGELEIASTRVFEAQLEVVWMMFTVPEYVMKWWGPRGFTTTIQEMDVRPGRVWRFVMHGPDGKNYPNEIAYDEIVPLERLVYTHGPKPRFQTTVSFKDLGGRTAVTMRGLFESAEDLRFAVEEHGAVEGLNQTLARLGEMLHEATTKREATIRRDFDAPRETVFRAWVDPKQMAQWWGPHGFTAPVCELDPRPGGRILIHMQWADGRIDVCTGEFREVVQPERLVFITRAFENEQGEAALQTLNTVTFEDLGARTQITLHACIEKLAPELAAAGAGMEAGWSQSLDKLSTLLVT